MNKVFIGITGGGMGLKMSERIEANLIKAEIAKKDLDAILRIVEDIENATKCREKRAENQRKYGVLTEEDLRKRFTI